MRDCVNVPNTSMACLWIVQGEPDDFVPCPASLDEIERASLAFQVNVVIVCKSAVMCLSPAANRAGSSVINE